MIKFIKNFGFGLIYFLALPILLVAVIGYLVYGFGAWVFYCVKGVIRFFKGDSFFYELEEDAKVRQYKIKLAEASTTPTPAPAPAPQQTVSNQTTNTNSNQTYNVTNNYFAQTPGINPQGIATPSVGIDPNQQRIDMSSNTIDLTEDKVPNAQLSDNLSSQQQIEAPSTPLIGTNPNPQNYGGIDLSLDEEDDK